MLCVSYMECMRQNLVISRFCSFGIHDFQTVVGKMITVTDLILITK